MPIRGRRTQANFVICGSDIGVASWIANGSSRSTIVTFLISGAAVSDPRASSMISTVRGQLSCSLPTEVLTLSFEFVIRLTGLYVLVR